MTTRTLRKELRTRLKILLRTPRRPFQSWGQQARETSPAEALLVSGSCTCLATAAALVAALTACAGPRESLTDKVPLVLGVSRIPEHLSPLSVVRTPEEQLLAAMIFEGLYQTDPGAREAAIPTARLARGLPQPLTEDLMEFIVDLREGARWHDGQSFTPADVEYSWQVLRDPRNDYPDRILLQAYVISISGTGCRGCVRVRLARAAAPEDVAWLLTFPVVPHKHRASRGLTFSPLLVHPDSAPGSDVLEHLLRHPVGTGAFALEGPLGPGAPILNLGRVGTGTSVLIRVIATPAAQRAALENGEIDVLLEPDSSLLLRPPSPLEARESQRTVQIALVLNPARATLASEERRRRVASLLRAALAEPSEQGCSRGGQRLPADEFRVVTTESGPLLEAARGRLRKAVGCLGAVLRVSRARGSTGLIQTPSHDGMLIRLGDRIGDVSAVMVPLLQTQAVAYGSANRQYGDWLATPSRLARDSIRNHLLRTLEQSGDLVYVAERRHTILVSAMVTGVSVGPDGTLSGQEQWGWLRGQ